MKVISANPISNTLIMRSRPKKQLRLKLGKQVERLFFVGSGLIGWSALLIASYMHDMLFLEELLTVSFIIWCVIVLHFIQPTGTEWIEDKDKI